MRIFIILAFMAIASVSYGAKPKVTIKKIQKETIENSLLFPVVVRSKVESRIQADNAYIIIKKLVKLGQKVKKGTPLLVLRNQDLSIHYENRILRSPMAGTVASISVQAGKFVRRGEGLLYINDPEKLFGQIELSPVDYKKLKTGLKGNINFKNLKLNNIPVTVQAIGSTLDATTGTVTAELEISPKDTKKLIPGIIGQAEITLNQQKLVLVKEKALYYIGEDVFLPIIKDGKVKKVKIELGKRIKDKVELIKGVELDQEYVANSPRFLRDNEEVDRSEKK